MSRGLLGVNVLLAVACSQRALPTPGPQPVPSELAGPFATKGHSGVPMRTIPALAEAHPRAEAGPVAPPWDGEFAVDQLTAEVTGASFDTSGGDLLQDALDDAAAAGRPVDEYGAGALSMLELFGDDVHNGVCELPQVTYETDFGGETWDITLGLAMAEVFVGDLELLYGPMSSTCEAALLTAAGDPDAAVDAGCDDLEIEMFLPEGSDCRQCLSDRAGDLAVCRDAGSCAEEAPVLAESGGRVWNQAQATLLACAPDVTLSAYVLADYGDDGSPPDPFDLDRWGYLCAPFWSDYYGDVEYSCSGGQDTVRAGQHGIVEGMRREGDDTPWYRHRAFYTPRIRLEDGTELRAGWEAFTSLGILSQPPEPIDSNDDGVADEQDGGFGYGNNGWGLNPAQVRPDGSDASVLDDTYARDWFAAIALKTATTRDGIPIIMANHSRCAADAWEDLDGDGVYRCTDMDWPTGGWLNDGAHFWYSHEAGIEYAFPIATLASTGLPDPDIPGGIVPWVAGSPTLGDPDWDDCAWEHTFVPDRAPLPDTPYDYDGPASLWGDSWRFGAHDEDVRLVLYTDVTRDFCPDGVEP